MRGECRVRLLLVLVVGLIPSACRAQRPSTAPKYDQWKLVAQSDLILKAELITPVEAISAALASKYHTYVTLRARIGGVLKGGRPNSAKVEIKYYTKPESYSPSAQDVIGLDRRDVLVFLLQVEDAPIGGLYFAGSTPKALQLAAPATEAAVRDEVENQRRILAAYAKSKEAQPDPQHKQVQALIQHMLDKRFEQAAFEKLERMGQAAVPSMIRLMDDRRSLPIHSIAFKNKSPNAFEEYAQYGPESVVDAAASLLGYITGEDFGILNNGGSERERSRTVDGWRINLHYLTR